MRYELTDYEWAAIKPYLPNKPRGVLYRRLALIFSNAAEPGHSVVASS
jgi:transposase